MHGHLHEALELLLVALTAGLPGRVRHRSIVRSGIVRVFLEVAGVAINTVILAVLAHGAELLDRIMAAIAGADLHIGLFLLLLRAFRLILCVGGGQPCSCHE